MTLRPYFPEIEPYASGILDLDGLHRMYWEESGNPDGIPALFLHGGPGAGATPTHRRLFDPAAYRIIIFDQRGAGRSSPRGELQDNTTEHLLDDIERLRTMRGVDRWLVMGGSWGSTLALTYGQAHPDRCLGLILRGVTLLRRTEIDWFVNGMRNFFPEAWRSFAGFIPPDERTDLLAAYYRRLSAPDPAIHLPAARAWSHYEGACAALIPSTEGQAPFADDTVALGLGRIEAHYFQCEDYFERRPLLDGVAAVRSIPATIIQGRYDVMCPIVTADELAAAWPEARYVIVPDAGHMGAEPGIRSAEIEATERFKVQRAF